jgi:hypothetical protein
VGLACVRFTVGRMMLASAILAVTWSAFVGIMELGIYRSNVEAEQFYREAAMLEAKRDLTAAAVWQASAEETARMNHASWSHIAPFMLLISLGTILGLGIIS